MKIKNAVCGCIFTVFCLQALAAVPCIASSDEFKPLAGVWRSESLDNENVLVADGKQNMISGQEHFPIAVFTGTPDFREGVISLRFKAISGKSDQAGGIFFARKENGDYLVLRANALENNLNLYSYVSGRRSLIQEIANVPVKSGEWHEIKIEISGLALKGYLDGVFLLEQSLKQRVSGEIGLWSKDDSTTLFKEFNVMPSAE